MLGRLRESAPATPQAVALILAAVDRIRFILAEIEAREAEPEGGDDDLVDAIARETNWAASESVPDMQATVAPDAGNLPQARAGEATDRRSDGDRRGHGTVRVAVDTLELIMTLVSELVLARNQLAVIARRTGRTDVETGLQRLSSVVTDLQDSVMHARMQPLDRVFSTLPRLVRDLARDLGKQIELAVEGGETELDRQLVELVRDPITHLMRNCADHGIENVEERLAAGKSATGRISVAASQAAGQVFISVSDDGRGLDHGRIVDRALALGLIAPEERDSLDRDDIARLIFAPGFSTAAQVTSVSGRGVGLDVVRENIEAIGGTVSVDSNSSAGLGFLLRIPLTLAIAPALIVAAGGERFALPQGDVVEIVAVGEDSPHRVETVGGCDVLHLRGEVVALVSLASLLGLAPLPTAGMDRVIAILRAGEIIFGIEVDAVDDVQEIVVKPVGATLAALRIYGGHTILGDGAVVLIIDILALAGMLGLRDSASRRSAVPRVARLTAQSASLLLFRAGGRAVRALPLSLIARIETVPAREVEAVAGRLLWRRDGRLIALASLVETAGDAAWLSGDGHRPALMIEAAGQAFGLLVDEIVDIAEGTLDIDVAARAPGLLGVAQIGSHVAEFVDVYDLTARAGQPSRIAQGCRVLLAETRPLVRDMLTPVLSAAGCQVVTASSPAEALARVASTRFDIAFTQADDPEATGHGLVARLREVAPSLPLVAVVAHPDDLDARDVAGCVAVCGALDRRGLLVALESTLSGRPPRIAGGTR